MLFIACINHELEKSQNSSANEEPGKMATGPTLFMMW